MKRFFIIFAAMLLVSVSAFAQSKTPLKGDVNEDGVVDVADITAIIAIMKNGGGTGESTTYYWYVGHENPMNMTSITPLPSNDASEGAGWRTIGTTLPTYTKNDPLWNNNMYGTISTASSKSTQYMTLPSIDIKSRNDITGEDITSDGWNNVGTKILNNVTYIVYSSVNTKKSFMDTLY